ncbi:hypothetical protein FRC19_002970, partial [Serendipita sp. 401]
LQLLSSTASNPPSPALPAAPAPIQTKLSNQPPHPPLSNGILHQHHRYAHG